MIRCYSIFLSNTSSKRISQAEIIPVQNFVMQLKVQGSWYVKCDLRHLINLPYPRVLYVSTELFTFICSEIGVKKLCTLC